MPLFNDPSFWIFMTTFFGGMFGLIKLYFTFRDNSNAKKIQGEMSIEKIKEDNIQKAIDYLNGAMSRIEPLVMKHEQALKKIEEAVKIIGSVEKNLSSMSKELIDKYNVFQIQTTILTDLFQNTIDRVNEIEQKLILGKVIKL